jgi:hypothetical protein
VVFWRYRKYIIIATSLVAITFLFSLWHVYTRMMEAQTISTIKALLGSFELSLDSITDSLETAFDFLPIQSIVLSTLNLITLVFAIFFFHTFSKLQSRLEIERSTSTN